LRFKINECFAVLYELERHLFHKTSLYNYIPRHGDDKNFFPWQPSLQAPATQTENYKGGN